MANFNINKAGFVIAAVFVITWLAALAIWRYGRIEEKWDAAMLTGAPGPDASESPHTAAGRS